MPSIEDAIRLALDTHAGQKDKAGMPYILHPIRVMTRLKSDDEMIVAILHDIIEDSLNNATPVTKEILISMGYPDIIVNAIDGLTRRKEETYEDFIARAGNDPLSRKVKIADLEDNMDPSRALPPDKKNLERLEKYKRSMRYLKEL
jgi:(p)ppGpp synthase/HD superfamily hydrolase